MKNIISEAFLTVLLFFAIWFGLSNINWMEILKVKEQKVKTEEKLGTMILDNFFDSSTEIKEENILNSIDSIFTKICDKNNIDKNSIKLHVVNNEKINAFAIPGQHIVLFSGLIEECNNPEELSGVISHELAHIQLNHVMKRLIKEIGLSVIVSLTTGNGGTDIVPEITKLLSASAFDRKLENDADLKAVDYLTKAKINPEAFANFLYKLSYEDDDKLDILTWVSTHDDSKLRAENIINYMPKDSTEYQKVIHEYTWSELKVSLQNWGND